MMVPASDTLVRNELDDQAQRWLRWRAIGLAVTIIAAHGFVALALHYTWMDDDDHFHTSYLSFAAAIACFLAFSVFVGKR